MAEVLQRRRSAWLEDEDLPVILAGDEEDFDDEDLEDEDWDDEDEEDWDDDEDTEIRWAKARAIREHLLEEIDLVTEAAKQKDPRRE